jgi:hypothetical protein
VGVAGRVADRELRSKESGSAREIGSVDLKSGLEAGETKGDVWRASGTLEEVSKTKKASPPSPSFMGKSRRSLLTVNSTFFSEGLRRENLPKRTWKGEQASEPSSCSTTMTSIAPLRVAGLIEFHVLDTEPDKDRTYCMAPTGGRTLKLGLGACGERAG